jgi:hypothetical protein
MEGNGTMYIFITFYNTDEIYLEKRISASETARLEKRLTQ